MILTKAIKPRKLKKEVFRQEFEVEAEAISKDILLDFELTTATWKTKVKFERLVSVGPNSIDVFVGTDNKIYLYINDGTRGHFVAPVRASALRFPKVYKAKSMPGVIASGSGGASGGFAYSKGHFVKGIKARKFDKTIQKMWRKKYKRRMEKALSRATKKSNHAM